MAAEARQLLQDALDALRRAPVERFVRLAETAETREVVARSGRRYRVETIAFWDRGTPGESDLLVEVSVSAASGWRRLFASTARLIVDAHSGVIRPSAGPPSDE